VKSFNLENNKISQEGPLYFIADIGANHDGKIERAFDLIELAKEAGAHAAKFQNFQAKYIVSNEGFKSLEGKLSHQSTWKKSVYETYEDASISFDWTIRLKQKCDEVGITFFTSPYDFESVDHVDPHVAAYKIGSGDVTWHEIVEYISKKNKPVLIATGASSFDEVLQAMDIIKKFNDNIVLMQCNTNYTASIENFKYVNLNVLKTYSEYFPDVILGLSDHTHGHSTVVGSIPLGARVFEKHFTDDNNRLGPDHKFAMNPQTWKIMVDAANEVFLALGDGKKIIEDNEKETAVVQKRSLRFSSEFPKGHILKREDLIPLRPIPSDGVSASMVDKVLGIKLNRDVKKGDYLKLGDITKC
tara:strand:+ start:64 stop:1137 length:1074 start_codon:yes stop_codon:yes gene_type:complete